MSASFVLLLLQPFVGVSTPPSFFTRIVVVHEDLLRQIQRVGFHVHGTAPGLMCFWRATQYHTLNIFYVGTTLHCVGLASRIKSKSI